MSSYKYMKTSKIDVQGSIDIVSSTTGTLTQDLTGNYDIDDIKTLLGGYMVINEDNPDFEEVGLRNYFAHPTYLDTSSITIKKATSGFDVTKYNNLLKLLGFSNGRTLYTTDQTYSEYEVGFGVVHSPYMGGKIPLRFSIPNNKLKGGYSTYEPISIKAEGKDYVSNTDVHSNNFRIRRGYTLKFRGTERFLDQIDVTKDIFKSPIQWYFPTGFDINSSVPMTLLSHDNFNATMIYPTIGMQEFFITFLK